MIKRFIERRIPFLTGVGKFFREIQPSHVTWKHTFGSGLLFLLTVQLLTGGVLLLYYAPTPDHAWDSLSYLADHLSSAHLVRGMHVWGASLVVLLLTAHLLRVLIDGAYKAPRELNWISGLLSFLLILGFCFTGYLLPWDQKGYWGTRVGLEMIAKTPLVGPFLVRLLQGGEEIGAYTLSRFFALHVFFLPALLVILVGLHIYLLRVHKIAPDPDPRARPGRSFPFFPEQSLRDSAMSLALFGLLLLMALLFPAGLEPLADPSDLSYDPRPEWYFLAHYELLRLLAAVPLVAILVIPTLIIVGLLSVPFMDRSPALHWSRRKAPVLAVAGLFAVMYAAVPYSRVNHPSGGPATPAEALPLPSDGPAEQMIRARQVMVEQKCINCHRIKGSGGLQGPDLSQAGWKFSREHLRQQILDPRANKPDSRMPSFEGKISEQDLQAVVEYLSLML